MVYKKKNHKIENSIKKKEKKTTRRGNFKAVLDKDTPKEVKINRSFGVDRKGEWEKKKPKTMKQRKELHEKCGDDAFLLPEHLKFPICNKVKGKNHKCSYNCSGLKGASSRAGEWGYKNVLKNSKELTRDLGCYKNSEIKKDSPIKEKIPKEKMVGKKKPIKKEKNPIERVLSIFS